MLYKILYRKNLYKKIGIQLLYGKIVLDVGCGAGIDVYNLSPKVKKAVGLDITTSPEWKTYKKTNTSFKQGDAKKMPFKKDTFTGVYLKDVLHHIDNPEQVLKEIDRVTKKGSVILLIEANRYNPLFYLYMRLYPEHQHLTQKHFKSIIQKQFKHVTFKHFESHWLSTENKIIIPILQITEKIMESIPFMTPFLSYNVAIIKK